MERSGKTGVIVIAGATATGKSSVGVKLALRLGGEIVNADSMQVYRGMDIGTAKPSSEQRRLVPHHLLDVVDPDEPFNAAAYRSLALPVIEEIGSRNKLAFVVGGTGLYIRVLLGGLFECPQAVADLRESLRNECERSGPAKLHDRLAHLDPQAAEKIHPHDKVRITRALEVFYTTGRKASELTALHGFRDNRLEALKFCLDVDREVLYRQIDQRVLEMVDSGLVEETKRLLRFGYSPELKPMKALGYRHMVKYLQGLWSLDEAIKELQKDTRRYAKRQLTWFRGDPEMRWVAPEDIETVVREIRSFVDLKRSRISLDMRGLCW